MIKDLVVHLDGSADDESRLRHAEALAARHEAHLTGLFTNLLVDLTMAMPLDGGASAAAIMKDLHDEARRQGDSNEQRLIERFQHLGVRNELRRLDGTFVELSDAAVTEARGADLFIASRPYRDQGSASWGELFEAVLFEGGRSLYVVSGERHPSASIGRVLIAWRDTREATRAVAEAMPLIESGASATVLVVDANAAASAGAEPGAAIVRHLDRHGAEVELAQVESGGRRVSDVLLEEARRVSADLIVMGGYGHSRAREWVLGGATMEMLEHSEFPILMAH